MNELYSKIWELAKPYYEKGRPMDIAHIEWFMKTAEDICKVENLDDSLLLPLAILHDVGYSELQNKEANYYDTDIRRAHMKAGRVIAEEILQEVGYPTDKSEKIIEYVGIHDNWAFGEVDIYTNDAVLGTFKDLDYLWIYTKEGCKAIQIILKKSDTEMLEYLQNEQSPIGGKKPFSNESTRVLHDSLLHAREADFKIFGSKEKK